jgi:hypothetical protein
MSFDLRIWQRIVGRRQAYRRVLLNPGGDLKCDADVVMRDLARFCRANRACIVYGQNGHIDPIASAVVQGRREVWLRIAEHLHLSDAVVTNLIPPTETEQ